ncbi:MAG TPA: kelch repeat-containing protein [Planctomycetota bacterium]|nr:kelch repeat-containing protein [Planctomycetota bacterium]
MTHPLRRLLPLTCLLGAATAQQWAPVATQPRYRAGHVMATDPYTGRPLLFGGSSVYNWFSSPVVDADTWRWNGNAWFRLDSASAPPANAGMVMAADLQRQRTVLVVTDATPVQTWEWDGSSWTQRTPATAPPSGSTLGAGMAYDLARGRCVLFTVLAGASAQTWEWDGTNWAQVITAQDPGLRFGFRLAHDISRSRTVLFGGEDGSRQHNGFNDTWEYDGTNWTLVSTPASPTPRAEFTMIWTGAGMLLFGGRLGPNLFTDTWTYDGVSWTAQNPATPPPPQVEPQMALDDISGNAVLFTAHDTGSGAVPETWQWDGSNWTQTATLPAPPVREMHGIADDAHGQLLLFGGYNAAFSGLGGAAFNDTWRFDGRRWQLATPASSPPRRGFFGISTDVLRQRVVLFGGEDVSQQYGDTWEWDGATWAQASTSGPQPRSHAAMAYDHARGVTLLNGGNDPNQEFGDSWLWNGTQWQQVPLGAGTPGPRSDHAMAFDQGRNVVVLFGGQVATVPQNDLWEWNGLQWTQRAAVTPPAPRYFHDFTYDQDRQRLVLHGGFDTVTAADTWEYDGVANTWTQITAGDQVGAATASGAAWDPIGHRVLLWDGSALWAFTSTPAVAGTYGSGCGAAGVPALVAAGRPFLGNPVFGFEARNAAIGALGFLFLDLAIGNTQLPGGCTVLLQTPQYWVFTIAGQTGLAEFHTPMVANAALKGLNAFAQAATLDLFGQLALTNGVRMRLGD